MKMLGLIVLLAGCLDSGAPELHSLSCTPETLRASGAGPFTLSCDLEFDGEPGDIRWSGYGANGLWAAGSDFIESADRDRGRFHFSLSKPTAPPVGTLTILVTVDHVEGIDGPAGDELEKRLQVVP